VTFCATIEILRPGLSQQPGRTGPHGAVSCGQARSLFDVNGCAFSRKARMEKLLSGVGSLLYGMRFTMLFFYVGLVAIIFGILGKFLLETYKLMSTLLFGELQKIDLIIKVLELVDMTMVAQLVWVVALAGVSLFVTTGHFDKKDMKKPDWLDHVNTYNLKLKLAFAIISISGVHALKTYLSGDLSLESIQIVTMVAVIHFTFVLSAIGISFAERLTREKT
jgi:uncharacterized protein (TIGR00645 family)